MGLFPCHWWGLIQFGSNGIGPVWVDGPCQREGRSSTVTVWHYITQQCVQSYLHHGALQNLTSPLSNPPKGSPSGEWEGFCKKQHTKLQTVCSPLGQCFSTITALGNSLVSRFNVFENHVLLFNHDVACETSECFHEWKKYSTNWIWKEGIDY